MSARPVRILVVDGMGGRIGQEVVARLRAELPAECAEILAVGTNSSATSAMLKAGANRGATGENAVVVTAREADVLVGPLSILVADSMMGEVTPVIAHALASSPARKIMLPLTNPRIEIVGADRRPLPHLLDDTIALVSDICGRRR